MIKEVKRGFYNEKDVIEYTLTNINGVSISILNLGGIITKIMTPNKEGKLENIVLAYENIEDYYTNPSYYGAIIGRTAGRIDKGETTINDKVYELSKNYGVNSGHGGQVGFDKKFWDVKDISDDEATRLELSIESYDLEENYPGNLTVKVIYELNDYNEFLFKIKAISDKDTLVNMTNHSYFNLSGDYKRDILNEELYINSDKILNIDENGGVTGEEYEVSDTPFDFRKPHKIGERIDSDDPQVKLGFGYDHPFMLNKEDRRVVLKDEESGRVLEIQTDQESVVVYSMNFINYCTIYGGMTPRRRLGICFETQAPPIGYNEVFKEKSYISAGEIYSKTTKYTFKVEK